MYPVKNLDFIRLKQRKSCFNGKVLISPASLKKEGSEFSSLTILTGFTD